MRIFSRFWFFTVLLLVAGYLLPSVISKMTPARVVTWPSEVLGHIDFEKRQVDQIAASSELDVFHQFQFQDRIDESGITFTHRVVPDASSNYLAVHYDHGNGMSIADVDNDGFIDIYFVNQLAKNELWRNLGNGKFEDITELSGVDIKDSVSVSASFADIDNDGDSDLYVTTVRDGNKLFENNGGGKFTDISKQAGVDYEGHSSGATFFDFDRDGLLDLFVANLGKYTEPEKVSASLFGPTGFTEDYQYCPGKE